MCTMPTNLSNELRHFLVCHKDSYIFLAQYIHLVFRFSERYNQKTKFDLLLFMFSSAISSSWYEFPSFVTELKAPRKHKRLYIDLFEADFPFSYLHL